MASIQTGIELNDHFSGILNNIVNSVNLAISAMADMQGTMNADIDTASLEAARAEINQATIAVNELEQALQNADTASPDMATPSPAPVEVPVVWQSNSLDVFTNSGVERFEQEVQSTNNILNTLNQTQAQIAARAAQTNIFPPDMVTDMNGMQSRLQAIQERIQAIENNPVNMGTDAANAELEQLRTQLNQAVQEQELMNRAVENMDVQAANEAYLRLSQIIGGTERHIRDNVDEQGRFRREIEQSTNSAAGLKNMIASAVGAFVGMAGVRKAVSWIEECTEAFDVQRNAELQLMSVLANTIEAEVTVDTSEAVTAIGDIQNHADDVMINVSADTQALQNAFDTITAKASEIQGRGIYGDEAMIAAAAEFSTYFTDTDAIEMMMDTLTNYTIGMENGVSEVDASAMVDYATNLGKIMSGSYDAMTKKGFEFSDAQKAIIEGEATREQIVAALGEEYVDMSADMQAAAAITQVIDEAWAGLYETMSNTPEGKILQMVHVWGDMKEVIGGQLYPYVILFVDVITSNWPTIQKVLDNITLGLQVMMGVLSWLLEGAFGFAQIVIDNWSWISPIVYGIAAALAVYGTYLAITKGLELAATAGAGALAVGKGLLAAATMVSTGATWAETTAQMGLNSAMYACPIVWIVVLIIALIAAFYAAVAAINKFAGTSISATGLIAGYFGVCVAHFLNGFIRIQNVAASFANFLGNFMNDPIAAIKVLFYDMCLTVIGYILNMASAIEAVINKIPGISVDITSGLDGFYSQLEEAQQAVKDESEWVEYVHKMDYIDYTDAFGMGYSFGEGIEDKISSFDPASLFNVEGIPDLDDYASALSDGGIGSGIDDILVNTDSIKDSLDCTEEDLKYLRDIAEQEAVNRFTIAEVKVEQTNHNNINSGMDLDGIVSGLTDAVNDAVDSITEGV